MPEPTPEPASTGPHHAAPRRWIRVLVVVCLLQFILLLVLHHLWEVRTPPVFRRLPVYSPTNRVAHFVGHPGPWGELEYVRINIEPPDDFVPLDDRPMPPSRWFFPDHSPAQLSALFEASDLTPEQRTALLDTAAWLVETNGITLVPAPGLILDLSPGARAQIYSVLARSERNDLQCWPFTFRDGGLDDWFGQSGIADATVALLKRMAYTRGPSLCFSDLPVLFSQVTDPRERQRVVKALSRHSTVLMKLRVYPDSDFKALTAYWGRGRRTKDLGPFLESLTKIPGGITVDLAHLLPPFARKRLNSYPPPAAPGQHAPDCYWTAWNFFTDPPDDRYFDDTLWRQELQDHCQVVEQPVLGDLVFLTRPDGVPIHCAVFVADDVVFTKNGANERQPWILMKLEDMLARYPADYPKRVTYFRNTKLGLE
jgi:hypothetical protein